MITGQFLSIGYVTWAKLLVLVIVLGFIPMTAIAHFRLRQPRRKVELKRTFSILHLDCDLRRAFVAVNPGLHYFLSAGYCLIVSAAGLFLLLFAPDWGLTEFPAVTTANITFPAEGSRLITAMAFLGAYLWGIQHIFRRYTLNDLIPGVYYGLSMRILFASVVALVIFNAFEALAGSSGEGGLIMKTWPALALVVGMFPQRGFGWLMEKVPVFSSTSDPSVRNLPLEMIEGIEVHDRMRLEELGIDTCYDLATADFVPLMLKSPYCARQLVDWILQAKLCVFFGPAVKDLRQHSIRTIEDLLSVEDMEALAAETAVTRSALQQARRTVEKDQEISRLGEAARLLGRFWEDSDTTPADASCAASDA